MKTIDITNLTDAALDVLFAVKLGTECVSVDHLTHAERYSVCVALGVEMPADWRAPYRAPASRPVRFPDVEGMILDRQDEFFDD